MKKIVFSLVILFVCFSFSPHKYYHSVCSFELDAKTGGAEVVLEVFHDDLLTALSKKNNKSIKIDDKEMDTYVSNYLSENFILKDAGGNPRKFSFVGTEVKNDVLNVFFEYKELKSLSGFSLTNSILVREFPEQVNKVNFKTPDWKKTFVYTAKITRLQVES